VNEPQQPAAPHPAHDGLPALYMAELSVWRDQWQMIVVALGPEVVVDALIIGPAQAVAVFAPDSPGNHLIDPGPRPRPVPPVTEAAQKLAAAGYTIDTAAWGDPSRLHGWIQATYDYWTAPCHPAAMPA
jgi:hypothetical protein